MPRGLPALACLLAACQRAPPPAPPPPAAAAVVNGQPVPVELVQRELERLRRISTGEAPAPVDPREVPDLARALLGPLIDRALLLQEARKAGLLVTDAEVQGEIDRLSSAALEGGEPFEERLRKDGQTPDALAAEIRDRLLAEKYVAMQVRPGAPLAVDVKAWYDAHRAELDQPESVRAQQIVVASAEEAKSLLDRLRKGASFEELAQAHSQSPDGKRGGDLGWFGRGTMPKVFDDTCFSLRVGELSGVVPSPYGFHLFKVLDRRPAKRRSLEDARPDILRQLGKERRAAAERQVVEALRASAKVQINEAQLRALQ